jgi:hypothetical protein
LPRPPYIKAARFPQEKILQDELPFAGKERPVGDPARYFQIDGLRARLSFNNLVESKAALAAEKRNCIRIRHVAPTSLLAWCGEIIVAHRV